MHATAPTIDTPAENRLVVRDEQPLALAEQSGAVNRWKITLETVRETITRLNLNETEANALLWLQNYGWSSRKSLAEVAGELKRGGNKSYDKNTLWKVLNGKHEAKLDTFVAAVVDLNERLESRRIVAFPFVRTARCEEIWEFCEMAGTYQDFVSIIGWSHSGKSEAVKAFAKKVNKDHYGRVPVIEIPPDGHRAETQELIGHAVGISTKYKTAKMLEHIVKTVNSSMTLVFDDVYRIFTGKKPRIGTLELIRYIHDRTGCGIVLVLNEEARSVMEDAATSEREGGIGENEATFASLLNREGACLRIERCHSNDDLALFARAIGLPAATGDALKLQTATNTHQSLGKWIRLLRRSMKAAANRKEKLTWNHVIQTDRFYAAKQGRVK